MNFFWKIILFFVVIRYGFFGLLFPWISQWAVGAPNLLPAPAAALSMYTWLMMAAIAIYILSSEERSVDFMSPVHQFLKPQTSSLKKGIQLVVMVTIPLFGGWSYFDSNSPKMVSQTAVRIQHPTMPGSFEGMENPMRHPTEEQLEKFIAEQKELAEEAADEEEMEPVTVPNNMEEGRLALIAKWTEEGAALYAVNCRPCHGMQADGIGPMAVGWRLQPANFRDPGTIATIVEEYAFWRVSKGGPGLPSASTPWDSAMPIWDLDLTEDERWKLLLGEYFLAGVGPRQTEKLE